MNHEQPVANGNLNGSTPVEIATRKSGRLFLVWTALFAAMGFLLWLGIRFCSPLLRMGPSSSTSLVDAGTLPALYPSDSAPLFRIGVIGPSPQDFIGRRAEFQNVTVTATEGSTFRIQGQGGHTVLAASWSSQPPGLSPGETVSVSGLILNIPRIEVIQEQWGLSAADAAQLEQDKIYLRVSTIEKGGG